MIRRVTARAYANIALIKYWGKQPEKLNSPATPSIALSLGKLKTETIIERVQSRDDRFFINGSKVDHASSRRLRDYLNFWRKGKLVEGHFEINSTNNFPTKSGLASSSSGYAALATGLIAFSRRKLSISRLSQLARVGSGSAARSIVGGLAALPNTSNPAAKLLLPADKVPWGMLIAVADIAEKEFGSREGMKLSRKTSPYFNSWVKCAEADYRSALKAIKKLDFTAVGELTEANSLAMHACMIATRPSLLYWNSVTLDLLKAARNLRKAGIEIYATMDAGANVAFLCRKNDLNKIAGRIRRIKGVLSVLECNPAAGASVIKWQ
jgi:diphosphomevalonate decarboxylase